MTKPKQLTIGMRVRILTAAEMTKKFGKTNPKRNDYFWNQIEGGKHALLQERSNGSFSILTIGDRWKNKRILPKKTTGVIDGAAAWVNEDAMEFVNADFEANMDYLDWYQEHEDDFCGDCGEWFPKRGATDPKTGKDCRCPNKECPGARWDNVECPHCGTKLTGKTYTKKTSPNQKCQRTMKTRSVQVVKE
jgi:hypothetical protein